MLFLNVCRVIAGAFVLVLMVMVLGSGSFEPRTLPDDPATLPEFEAVSGISTWEALEQDPHLYNEYANHLADYHRAIDLETIARSEHENWRESVLAITMVASAAFALLLLPWSRWFNNGAFVARRTAQSGVETAKRLKAVAKTAGPSIIGVSKLKQFSVADELVKWKKLLDDGLVSTEEFQSAQARLLGRTRDVAEDARESDRTAKTDV